MGVKVAAKLHLAAATRSLRDGVEFTELMLHDLLLAGPQASDLAPPLSDGYLNVPLGPGLGVTVDEEKMRAHDSPSTTDHPTRQPPARGVIFASASSTHRSIGGRGEVGRQAEWRLRLLRHLLVQSQEPRRPRLAATH